jgi:peptidoglycan/LPS O-acetylase OafA/YrhL
MSINKSIRTGCDNRFAPIPFNTTSGRVVYDYPLDGLRGLAALWVAYAHIFGFRYELDPTYHPTFPFQHYFHAAHGGVLIFFMLSGYVIGLTNRSPFSRANALQYLLRRFIRLYPIYAISIVLAVLTSPFDTWKTVVGNLFFLQGPIAALLSGNGVLWTLHYEVVYYLAFLAVWYFRPKITPLFLGTLVVTCLCWVIPSFPPILSGYAAGWLFWLFGLWLAWKKEPLGKAFTTPLFSYLLLIIATDRLFSLKNFLASSDFNSIYLSQVNLLDLAYFPICAVLFVAATNRSFSGFHFLEGLAFLLPLGLNSYWLATGRLFGNNMWIASVIHMVLAIVLIRWRLQPKILTIFAFIGSISYGIYILHMPMIHFVHNAFPWRGSAWSFTLRILAWSILTVSIAMFLELKLQPILKRWFNQSVIKRL